MATKDQVLVQTMLAPTRYTLPEGTRSRHTASPQLAQWILGLIAWGTEVEKYKGFAPITYRLQIEMFEYECLLLK